MHVCVHVGLVLVFDHQQVFKGILRPAPPSSATSAQEALSATAAITAIDMPQVNTAILFSLQRTDKGSAGYSKSVTHEALSATAAITAVDMPQVR